jgi:hypothetical protein
VVSSPGTQICHFGKIRPGFLIEAEKVDILIHFGIGAEKFSSAYATLHLWLFIIETTEFDGGH